MKNIYAVQVSQYLFRTPDAITIYNHLLTLEYF